jgi:Ca-activated chloride channel family protein
MMQYLQERFAPQPPFGWLCIALLLLIPIVWWRAVREGRRPTIRFSSIEVFHSIRASWATRARFILPVLRSLAIVALVIALARPQSGGEYVDTREGIAIQMVLDISGSMSEEDFVINGRPVRRLDAVKQVFRDFVAGGDSLRGRENDLIGMTTFAMFSDTNCPLTLDHGSVIDLLDETEIPGWVKGRQIREDEESAYTSIGDAIVLATDDLRRAGTQAVAGVPGAEAAKSRVMILLTDGANNPPPHATIDPPDPIAAAKVAAELGIKIYTIGAVGGGQTQRGIFSMMRQGRGVDEESLKGIAAATSGKYFRATDTKSLTTIYEEIDRLETRRTGERTFRDDIEAAKIAMLAGLGLLMTELLLVSTRFRRIP